jgi:hypothetical protein
MPEMTAKIRKGFYEKAKYVLYFLVDVLLLMITC